MESEQGQGNQSKKSSKPQMEKKRRERINNSLNELKTLILGAMKKDASYYSKLEKADILEMAVQHVKKLQKQLRASHISEANPAARYKEGYAMCASDVTRLLISLPGLDENVKVNVIKHMAACCSLPRFENEEETSPVPNLEKSYPVNNNYGVYESISHYNRLQQIEEQKLSEPKRTLYSNLFNFHSKGRKSEQISSVSSTTGISTLSGNHGGISAAPLKHPAEQMMFNNGVRLMPTTVLVPVPVTFSSFHFKGEADEEKKLWRPW